MVNIFANISASSKCKLLKILEANTYNLKKNDNIFPILKGEKTIGIVLSGLLQIVRIDYNGNKTLIEELEENDIFGNMVYPIPNREFNYIVKEDATIIIIDFNEILFCTSEKEYFTQFLKNLVAIIMQKLQAKNERLEILTKKTIRNKLLEYFNTMSKKHGSRFVYLPFNFSDLADYLVIDRSAMTREIKYLKEEGFIEVKGKRITLLYDFK